MGAGERCAWDVCVSGCVCVLSQYQLRVRELYERAMYREAIEEAEEATAIAEEHYGSNIPVHPYTHTPIHPPTQTSIHPYTHLYTHAPKHTYIHTSIRPIHPYTLHTPIHPYTQTPRHQYTQLLRSTTVPTYLLFHTSHPHTNTHMYR